MPTDQQVAVTETKLNLHPDDLKGQVIFVQPEVRGPRSLQKPHHGCKSEHFSNPDTPHIFKDHLLMEFRAQLDLGPDAGFIQGLLISVSVE